MSLLLTDDIETATDMLTAKNIGDVLEKKYPGYGWGVVVRDGVAMIRAMRLSGMFGFNIKTTEIDPDYKVIMRAGGEILERYNVRRAKADTDEIFNVPIDPRGHLIHQE